MTQILICPDCQEENPLTAEYCQKCNASLSGVAAEDFSSSLGSEQDDLDLLPHAEDDLPGLLHALKNEEDVSVDDDETPDYREDTASESLDLFDSDQPGENEEVPDWLHRVRQRASEETDSVGEITQKISAAKDSLIGEESESRRENFESWIKNIKGEETDEQAEELIAEKPLAEDADEASQKDPDWLSKIRQAEGKQIDSEHEEHPTLPDEAGNSLLQWLVALEDGEETPLPIPEVGSDDTEEVSESTQETQVEDDVPDDVTQQVVTGELKPRKAKTPELIVSREEKLKADQLAATIVDERSSRPIREPETHKAAWMIRLAFGVLLITILSLSLFIGGTAELPSGLFHAHNQAIITWADELPEEASLLLVFDYQAGYSDELSLVAKPVLSMISTSNPEVSILSSAASGVLLSQRLLNEVDQEGNLSITDLGYFPVGAYGAYGTANRPHSNWRIAYLPKPEKDLPTDNFEGILILSDNYEGVRTWVEQLGALSPDTPIYLLVTAQAGPMSMPYLASGQVTGMVSGISEAAGLEKLLGSGSAVAIRWHGYRAGVMILIGFLIVGFFVGEDRHSEAKARGDR